MALSLHLLAAVLLVLGHAVPSAPGLRERLIAGLGRDGFVALHSAVSLATLAFLVWTYLRVESVALYWPPEALRWAAVAAWLALLLLHPLLFGVDPLQGALSWS